MTLQIIILAAGKGTRMKSDLAKVLHQINGRHMVDYVLDTANKLSPENIYLIVGHQADMVKEVTKEYNVVYVEQKEQLGTGHAILVTEPQLKTKAGTSLILCGDVPLLTKKTIQTLIDHHHKQKAAGTILTIKLKDPKHYGRIIRQTDGDVEKIVEYRDATDEERKVNEINTGIYAFETAELFEAIHGLSTDNDQKEYYLTDVIEILKNKGKKVSAIATDHELEVHGINTVDDLKRAEKELNKINA
ncbi:NTP transferase domain-containing protein [Candidatus Margulisiibacteriota bacterium]